MEQPVHIYTFVDYAHESIIHRLIYLVLYLFSLSQIRKIEISVKYWYTCRDEIRVVDCAINRSDAALQPYSEIMNLDH